MDLNLFEVERRLCYVRPQNTEEVAGGRCKSPFSKLDRYIRSSSTVALRKEFRFYCNHAECYIARSECV